MTASRHWFTRAVLSLLLVAIFQFRAPLNPTRADQDISLNCAYRPLTQAMLDETRQEDWVSWIAQLSGARPISFNGQEYTITTRSSYAMFNQTGSPGSPTAYTYILETLKQWYPPAQIEEIPFTYLSHTWKNLALTLPGSRYPDQVVILTAHLDSTSSAPFTSAPGADDNAGGSAALLEAARLFRTHLFERTIRLIWFTGEEQGMIGSRAYAKTIALGGVIGVINLDMFSYDADNDRCLELQVGTLPQSNKVGSCFMQVITDYHLNLTSDYFIDQATYSSDHSSFWYAGIGAIQVGENFHSLSTPGGCSSDLGADQNPHYHKLTDTLDNINAPYGFSITQAALATIYNMAVPVSTYYLYIPVLLRSCTHSLTC